MNKQKPAPKEEPDLDESTQEDGPETVDAEIVEPVMEDVQSDENGQNQDSVEEFRARIRELDSELEASRDKLLRATAEVENIRRRSANEQINARKFAIEGFAGELLAVKDSLDLAQQVEIAKDNESAVQKMHEGISLTLKQLDKAFEKFAVEAIEPEIGDKLDPELHQAMTVQPSDEVGENCVLAVIQVGYRLHNRLLRPAMVVVARAPDQKKQQS